MVRMAYGCLRCKLTGNILIKIVSKGGGMNSIIRKKATSIYNAFTKGPIIEMVQYMVDHEVDAQCLHQLKLIDQRCHKNPHIKSYGKKVMACYERVCRVLVTYPSLELENGKFNIIKNKDGHFLEEFYGQKV